MENPLPNATMDDSVDEDCGELGEKVSKKQQGKGFVWFGPICRRYRESCDLS